MRLVRSIFVVCALGLVACVAQQAQAQNIDKTRPPSSAMRWPGGIASALSKGGTAHTNDISAALVNPAGLAVGKEFSFYGNLYWQNSNLLASEAGILDSMTSEIAAALLYRQTTQASGTKDKRFTLGLAERLGGDSPLLLGVSGDYYRLEKLDPDAKDTGIMDNIRLRAGAIYGLSDSLQVGIRTEGYLDERQDKEHALGASAGFLGYFLANGDLVFSSESLEQLLAGLTVSAKEYLDFRLSYGYQIQSSGHFGAMGLQVKSDYVRLFYNLSKPVLNGPQIDHNFGLSATMTL